MLRTQPLDLGRRGVSVRPFGLPQMAVFSSLSDPDRNRQAPESSDLGPNYEAHTRATRSLSNRKRPRLVEGRPDPNAEVQE